MAKQTTEPKTMAQAWDELYEKGLLKIPWKETGPDPWFQPVPGASTEPVELTECQKCAALVQDHANAMEQHRRWHEEHG